MYCTVYTVQCTVHSVHYEIYSTVYTAFCIILYTVYAYSLQFTLYSVQYTAYYIHSMEYILNIFATQYNTQYTQEILLECNKAMVLLMLSTAIAVLCDFSRVPVSIPTPSTNLRALLDLLNPHRSLSLVTAEWAILGLGIIWNFITSGFQYFAVTSSWNIRIKKRYYLSSKQISSKGRQVT